GDSDLADALELKQLAFDHHLRERDEQLEDLEVPLPEGDLECLHVEPVAGEDAGVIAPFDVGGGPAASRLGGVDHVVVDQGGGVDHLDDGAQVDRGPASAAGELGANQQQRGTETFAAARLEVLPDRRDGIHGRDRFGGNVLLDLHQLFVDEVEDLSGGTRLPQPP